MNAGVEVREATPEDAEDVRRVLDAAMLAVGDGLRGRIAAGDVLVATDGGPVLGALVLVPGGPVASRDGRGPGARVDAVAVRRARRGRGIGTALVRAAAARHPRLVAEFDPDARPFYESLGFRISPAGDEGDRLRGVYGTE